MACVVGKGREALADAVARFAAHVAAIPKVTVALRGTDGHDIVESARRLARSDSTSDCVIGFDICYDPSSVPDIDERASIHAAVKHELDDLALCTERLRLGGGRHVIVSYAIDCVGAWWKHAGYTCIGRRPPAAAGGPNRRND